MKYKLLMVILFSFYVQINCNLPIVQPESSAQVRCTRRFTAGSCAERVQPVWTYEPHLQNCTQRLGCKSSTVSNRFATRNQCIQTCHSLQDLYTIYQAADASNTSILLRESLSMNTLWYNDNNIARSDRHYASTVESYDYKEVTTSEEISEFHTEDVTPDVMDEVDEPYNPDLDLLVGLGL